MLTAKKSKGLSHHFKCRIVVFVSKIHDFMQSEVNANALIKLHAVSVGLPARLHHAVSLSLRGLEDVPCMLLCFFTTSLLAGCLMDKGSPVFV